MTGEGNRDAPADYEVVPTPGLSLPAAECRLPTSDVPEGVAVAMNDTTPEDEVKRLRTILLDIFEKTNEGEVANLCRDGLEPGW